MIKIEIAQDYTLKELQSLADILEPYGDGLIIENGTLYVVPDIMFTVCS